jgi:hypothetical protein
MRRLVITLWIALVTAQTNAQTNPQKIENYKSILNKYNQSVSDVNNSLLRLDSAKARKIIANNDDIYLRLLAADTASAKLFFKESTAFLQSFAQTLNNDAIPDSSKHRFMNSYFAQTEWFSQQQINSAGLEECAECYLVRKIRVTTLQRVSNSRLDTVKCLLVDYKKDLPNYTLGITQTLTSYPCHEYEQVVATGPNYIFTVHYNDKVFAIPKAINVGTAKTDIQEVSLILPKE